MLIASVDKGTHACGPDWAAVCRVIVLDIRRYACVLCLADNAPDRPASPSEFFTEDKRRLGRQTRQVGWRPPTRITTPGVVLPREKPCLPLSADASIIVYLCGKVNILNISFMLQDFAPDDIMPHKIYYRQLSRSWEGNRGTIYRSVTFFSSLSAARTFSTTPVESSSVSVRSSARSSRENATLFLPGAMPGPR